MVKRIIFPSVITGALLACFYALWWCGYQPEIKQRKQFETWREDNPMPLPKVWLPACYTTRDCYIRKVWLEAVINQAIIDARKRKTNH